VGYLAFREKCKSLRLPGFRKGINARSQTCQRQISERTCGKVGLVSRDSQTFELEPDDDANIGFLAGKNSSNLLNPIHRGHRARLLPIFGPSP
jgi:hypothetical protein